MRALPKATASSIPPVTTGLAVEVWIEDEDEGASVWAASTVSSIEPDGEFSVWVTEWDSLEPTDPGYAAAYEEGPYSAEEEGDEWRRVTSKAQATAAPTGREAAAVSKLNLAVSKLKRAGLANEDKSEWAAITTAVEALYEAAAPVDGASGWQPIATDTRLVGDWEMVGCTSPALAKKQGLTGLGAAPFTQPVVLHYSFAADGRVTAHETLAFFGKPVILNELRGETAFSDDGHDMREKYSEADLGGQQNSPAFQGADATLYASLITADGTLRLGRSAPFGKAGRYYIYRKMPDGGVAQYLETNLLPTDGGTYLGNPTWKGPLERAP